MQSRLLFQFKSHPIAQLIRYTLTVGWIIDRRGVIVRFRRTPNEVPCTTLGACRGPEASQQGSLPTLHPSPQWGRHLLQSRAPRLQCGARRGSRLLSRRLGRRGAFVGPPWSLRGAAVEASWGNLFDHLGVLRPSFLQQAPIWSQNGPRCTPNPSI